MRTFLIGTLAATLIGCSCLVLPQGSLQECTSQSCFDRTAAGPAIDLWPAPFKPDPSATNVKPTTAQKTAKSSSAQSGRADPVESVRSPSTTRLRSPASEQSAETSDALLIKAKATIAAQMDDPASAEFGDMKRAIRKNTLGQPVDTICGRVRGKNASGEDTGEKPFLYLVKDNEAYVVDGNAESAAAIAYRNICK
jgi:hypothetical protein